jgi:CBS domain containing-hemolysin-like protein
MKSGRSGDAFLADFKDFLVFLGSLWGLLAGISVFFPLSNTLLGVIPMKAYGADGVFDQLSPALITTVATIVTLFVILWTFASRDRLKAMGRRRALVHAGVSMGASLLALVAYLVIHQVYGEYAYNRWGWGSGDPRKLFAEIPLFFAYTVFFSLLTRAFVLIGMLEYFGSSDQAS